MYQPLWKPLVLPGPAAQVMKITSSGHDDALQQLEHVLAQDPGFSARVLAMANSPVFASSAQITTLKMALAYLGLKGIRNLTMTMAATDVFQCSSKADAIRAKAWWRLSCDSAICARSIGRERRMACADEAFLAALFHLVGRVQILAAFPDSYDAVETLFAQGQTIVEAERTVYGIDHLQILRLALSEDVFPEPILYGIDYQTAPEPNAPHAQTRALTALGIAIGDPQGLDGRPILPEWALEWIGESELSASGLIEDARCALAASSRT